MSFIRPSWNAPSSVNAVSTTRHFGRLGCSEGAFKSMNLGSHVNDDGYAVERNRIALAKALKLPDQPKWLDQVHGTDIIDSHHVNDQIPSADGSYTDQKNTVCVVMTADCLPLLMTTLDGDQVAAVHAGWRGLAGGVIENAVSRFNCPPQQLIAWAGPAIGPLNFEIGQEVKQQIGGPNEAYQAKDGGKFMANLYLLVRHRLAALGVHNYSHSNACTYSDSDRFFSYRRDGQCGRMASMIWIKDIT